MRELSNLSWIKWNKFDVLQWPGKQFQPFYLYFLILWQYCVFFESKIWDSHLVIRTHIVHQIPHWKFLTYFSSSKHFWDTFFIFSAPCIFWTNKFTILKMLIKKTKRWITLYYFKTFLILKIFLSLKIRISLGNIPRNLLAL